MLGHYLLAKYFDLGTGTEKLLFQYISMGIYG